MYNYQKTINIISEAIDTDEVDNIIEHFLESIATLYSEKAVIQELAVLIKEELNTRNYETNNKMKRALDLIETHTPIN
ncbi:MAG: hypothetical protein K8R85_09915 [Bacteroidetes bacterium]|nr:hypothetical protein [Bacteroidota bacterium]